MLHTWQWQQHAKIGNTFNSTVKYFRGRADPQKYNTVNNLNDQIILNEYFPNYGIYYIKLKSRPSVRIFLVQWFFAVDARIHVKFARNEAPVFWEHGVCFYNVLTPAVHHIRRFECQGVDDSCQNFTYIPANRSPDTIDNIYYICFQ